MIKITTVGPHDVNTKEYLFRERGALCASWVDSKKMGIYRIVYNAWPSNCMYELCDNYYNRIHEPYLAPIDLGDGIKLSPLNFMNMVIEQFKGVEYGYEEVVLYLKQLISEDTGVYKFMVTMEDISGDEKKKRRY
jgi:hypothetical protein